jgi:transcriptional regulator with XRE-family HTH domain
MKNSTTQQVGAELRRARKEAGLTLQAVADRLGCSRGQVCDIETGRRAQTVTTLKAYAVALGLELNVTLTNVK